MQRLMKPLMKSLSHTVVTAAFAPLALVVLALAGALLPVTEARAERIKDLASVQGVRMNQLIGYGLVVGLDGSGDQTTQTPFTVQSITSMLGQLGVNLPPGTSLQLKNVAAVMLTAQLPPFSQPGQTIDVTVSSMGNAKSLRGGTLVLSPLKGADGQIYAMAQGNVLVGGVGASTAGGSSVQINHLSVGRISAGATIERAVATQLGQDGYIYLGLNTTDFSTTRRVVAGINKKFGDGIASAIDARMIQVAAPVERDRRVEFVALLEELDVTPAESAAKVIINARTGSVIMNNRVTIDTCAISHGNLSVVITSEPIISQPGAFSSGQTVQANREQIEIRQDKGGLTMVRGANLSDVVKALNSIGATPQDLLAILQSMKAAGALRADLEII
jgi:flagellar P-ring protein FlgI